MVFMSLGSIMGWVVGGERGPERAALRKLAFDANAMLFLYCAECGIGIACYHQ